MTREELQGFFDYADDRRVVGAAGRLAQYAQGGGGPGLIAAVTVARSLAEGKSPLRASP